MKFTCLRIISVVSVLLSAVPVPADGLLYQLPEDGEWVRFNAGMDVIRGDQTNTAGGTLKMSSVGAVTEAGRKCRWIEFNFTMTANEADRVIVSKMLIPEVHLAEGQKPLENRLRGWIKMGSNGKVEKLSEKNLGPLPAFLSNPLTHVQLLEPTTVNCKLGELSCPGLKGQTEFIENNAKNRVTFETRRHEKAPFGVVTCRIRIRAEYNEAPIQALDMSLTPGDFGKAAGSELPDHW